ncbi:MAG: D-glutamate cyclase family protein [bacterium]
MYKTSIPCQESGIFKGNMVVSMRPYKPDQVPIAIQITS